MLNFNIVGTMDDWKKGDLPGNQMINIYLSEYATLSGGLIAISAQLASEQEVDYAIDELIKKLEHIRKAAKKISLKQIVKLRKC